MSEDPNLLSGDDWMKLHRSLVSRITEIERRMEAMALDVNILRVGLQNINKKPSPTFEPGSAYDLNAKPKETP